MSRPKLSEGALKTIMQGGQVENPIMQVLGSKKIVSNNSDKERYRILLSDGKYLISFAMFTTQVNDSINGGDLSNFSIIKLKRYVTSVINNSNSTAKGEKRVLVILDVEIVVPGDEVGEKIGSPETLPDDTEPEKPKSNGSSSAVPSKPVVSGASKAHSNSVDLNQSNLQNALTVPIIRLSPYQNKWVIKARVANKSSIRTWKNDRGEGKLFNIDLIDESGEIRATIFRELVDKYYDMIEVDRVYYISKCLLKVANKQFSNIKNDYEMTFTNDTVVQPCQDDDIDGIPQTQYDFTSIDRVAEIQAGEFIDIIGVCKSVGEMVTFTAKTTNREMKKRELTLVDTSNAAIQLTLWGNDAENFDDSSNPIIALKGAKVGEFGGGKSVSLIGSTVMKINPDIPEAHKLRGWFDNGGSKVEMANLSARTGGGNFQTQWMNFYEVKEANLGHNERGDYYQVKATVMLVRHENIMYKACPTENCNKKVIDHENGMFRCEKCSREFPNFKYRLLASMNIADCTGRQWVSMFSSEAEKVLGKTAEELGAEAEADPDSVAENVSKANFQEFIFKCRAKYEMYNDENRLKTVVVKVDNINMREYGNYLTSKIEPWLEM